MLNWLAARLRISQGIVDYVADDVRQSVLSKLIDNATFSSFCCVI
jgi:hypothetical protein